jgi:short subunit fatty acids transporter
MRSATSSRTRSPPPSSTPFTFPLLTAIGSSIVAVFIPSSGGQWVVQGFVTAKTAAALGRSLR